MAMTMTSADADQSRSSVGRHGVEHVDLARVHRAADAILARNRASWLPKPISTSTASGTSRMASIACSMPRSTSRPPWYSTMRVSASIAQEPPDAVGSWIGWIPAIGAVAHDGHVRQAQVALHHRGVRLAHLDDRVRRVRPAPLDTGSGCARCQPGHRGRRCASAGTRRVGRTAVRAAVAPPDALRASAASAPTCRARCRAAPPGRTPRTADPRRSAGPGSCGTDG